jgi:hypothetical protein
VAQGGRRPALGTARPRPACCRSRAAGARHARPHLHLQPPCRPGRLGRRHVALFEAIGREARRARRGHLGGCYVGLPDAECALGAVCGGGRARQGTCCERRHCEQDGGRCAGAACAAAAAAAGWAPPHRWRRRRRSPRRWLLACDGGTGGRGRAAVARAARAKRRGRPRQGGAGAARPGRRQHASRIAFPRTRRRGSPAFCAATARPPLGRGGVGHAGGSGCSSCGCRQTLFVCACPRTLLIAPPPAARRAPPAARRPPPNPRRPAPGARRPAPGARRPAPAPGGARGPPRTNDHTRANRRCKREAPATAAPGGAPPSSAGTRQARA